MSASDSGAPSLRRLLMDGVDVTTLDGYDHLLELLGELPTMTDERRSDRWEATWDVVSGKERNPHIRKPGEDHGWSSMDEYVNCFRYEFELLNSSATRAMFETNLPDDQREILRRKRIEVAMPTFGMCIDRGGNDGCTTCHEAIPGSDWHIAIWDHTDDDPTGGWILCMSCAATALPKGMPLLEVSS